MGKTSVIKTLRKQHNSTGSDAYEDASQLSILFIFYTWYSIMIHFILFIFKCIFSVGPEILEIKHYILYYSFYIILSDFKNLDN